MKTLYLLPMLCGLCLCGCAGPEFRLQPGDKVIFDGTIRADAFRHNFNVNKHNVGRVVELDRILWVKQ